MFPVGICETRPVPGVIFRSGDPVMHRWTARSHPIVWYSARSATGWLLNQLHWGWQRAQGEETRQEIIRKAAPIFNRKGYSDAALSDLMRATGLEKGGIYRHFESKQELAVDAFAHAWKTSAKCQVFSRWHDSTSAIQHAKRLAFNPFRIGYLGALSIAPGLPAHMSRTKQKEGQP
jgi:hypothetical protein